MNKTRIIFFSLLVLGFALAGVRAQQPSNIVRVDLSQAEIARIIKRFSQNEFNFRQALSVYAFNRDAKVQTIGMGGQVTGTYIRNSFLTFNEDGTRFEKVLYAPISTLRDLQVTPEDIDNLGGINPFAIEPKYVDQYNFTFVGKEKIDELDLYVFDVAPKVMPNPKKTLQKFFSGRIWVDDRDLMIVKSKGKAVPEGKDMNGVDQRFPIVETWRDSIDNKYWFPVLSTSDDELDFGKGGVVRMKMFVKYTNYRVGRTDVKILDDEQEVKDEPATPTPTPTPKKP
ncbi:MAG: hypothetical protein JSS81_10730 [Acidobacteria bacterium]|nr:hypothetical protein [Acidobacteriota bacterium]